MKVKPKRKRAESPFSKNLKTVLQDRGISQKAAAELCGVGQSTVVDWLSGSQPTDPIAIQRLCKSLDVDFEWILTGSISKPEIKSMSLSEIFETVEEPSFSGIFQIEAKRLKKRGNG